jgi:hypothetical protein
LEAAFLLTAEQIYLLANEDLSWSLSVDEVTRVWTSAVRETLLKSKLSGKITYVPLHPSILTMQSISP